MTTRTEYMQGDTSSKHRQYYAQFVNEAVKQRVLNYFSKEDLTIALGQDEHLNNLSIKKWDLMGGFAFRGSEMIMRPSNIEPVDIKLIREAGEGASASTMVCIYKEAARQIVESL